MPLAFVWIIFVSFQVSVSVGLEEQQSFLYPQKRNILENPYPLGLQAAPINGNLKGMAEPKVVDSRSKTGTESRNTGIHQRTETEADPDETRVPCGADIGPGMHVTHCEALSRHCCHDLTNKFYYCCDSLPIYRECCNLTTKYGCFHPKEMKCRYVSLLA